MKTKLAVSVFLVLSLTLVWAQATAGRSYGPKATANAETTPSPFEDCCQIEIVPALLTADDAVQVNVYGIWGNTCIPLYHSSYWVAPNVIVVNLVHDYPPDIVCAQVMTPWEYTVGVGTLASGDYQVMAYINDFRCGTNSFVVYEELYLLYLPAVFR